MNQYIWQNQEYPNFTYNKEIVLSLLAEVKLKQGYLLGKMSNIGFENDKTAILNVLTEEVIKSSEIEGLKLNEQQVRSSIAKRLGLDLGGDIYVERNVEGIVEMMLDATQNFDNALSHERLYGWQAAMFPAGFSGMYRIITGSYRDDKNGAMQVISGAVGHEKIHYEAPPANQLMNEMNKLIDFINTNVVVLTNKRLLFATKRLLFGYFFKAITPDMFNDITVTMGLIWGKVHIDTIKEVVHLSNIQREALDEIETNITEYMMSEKQKYNNLGLDREENN